MTLAEFLAETAAALGDTLDADEQAQAALV